MYFAPLLLNPWKRFSSRKFGVTGRLVAFASRDSLHSSQGASKECSPAFQLQRSATDGERSRVVRRFESPRGRSITHLESNVLMTLNTSNSWKWWNSSRIIAPEKSCTGGVECWRRHFIHRNDYRFFLRTPRKTFSRVSLILVTRCQIIGKGPTVQWLIPVRNRWSRSRR